MKIAYQVGMDDLVHFNLFHMRRSPSLQRLNRWALLLAVGVIIIALRPDSTIVAICMVFGGVAGAALFYSLYARWVTPWLVRKMLTEGTTRGVVGHHELEISPEGVWERTSDTEARHTWASVDRIVDDERYIFIYFQAVKAHVIPKSAFPTSEQAGVFMTEAVSLKSAAS